MAQQLPEGTVTILFTDVVGSTLLSNARGDVAAREIMRAQRDIVRQQLKDHSGHEVKGTGDGFMVAFQSARRAIGCAIGIQRAIEEQNIDRPADQRALVRIGVNAGEVIREDDDLFGTAVNAAARVAGKAEGGQILVSETVKALVRARDRGQRRAGSLLERIRRDLCLCEPEKRRFQPILAVCLHRQVPQRDTDAHRVARKSTAFGTSRKEIATYDSFFSPASLR